MTSILHSLLLILLTSLTGVCGGDWGVIMDSPCALRGAPVVIKCQYDYPFPNIVTSVTWWKYDPREGRWIPLDELAAPPDYIYVGNHRGDCSLRINRIRHEDSGHYRFIFVTTLNRWKSKRFAYVTVKELASAVWPTTVTEGDRVQLSCVSGCPTLPDAVWFRDGLRLRDPGRFFQASRWDAGSFHCALKDLETVRSASVTLKVQYPPGEVKLSMTPSGAVVKGALVTFGCSSDSNPPVEHSGYRLFKDGCLVTSGQRVSVSDIQPSHSGLYHCQAWNNVSLKGIRYFNSTPVHLEVQYPPVSVTVSMHPLRVMVGGGVNLTCTSDSNPAAENYTWYRRTHPTGSMQQQVGSGQLLSLLSVEASRSGLYLCQARNQLGEGNSTELLLLPVQDGTDSSHSNASALATAGVAVVLFLALGFALIFRRKQKHKCNAGMKANTDDSASVTPQPELRADTFGDEIVYTTVTIRDNGHHHKRSKDMEDSVIYSTVLTER